MSTRKKPPDKKRGPNVWVVHRSGRFSVKEEGSGWYLIPPLSQKIAIIVARMLARANRSELIVQDERGRIRPRDRHGSAPHPAKE